MKSHNVLALLLSSLSVISAVDTHAQSPAAVVSAMRTTNKYIVSDVTEIIRRCEVQALRKTFLEGEIVRRRPELTTLTATKNEFETQLTAASGVVTSERQALATLEAEITGLRSSIVNANTSATTLLANFWRDREAATKALATARKDLGAREKVYEEWEDSGSNQSALNFAFLIVVDNPSFQGFPAEQAAYDYYRKHTTEKTRLNDEIAKQLAIETDKTDQIKQLTEGRRNSVKELREQLTQKLRRLPSALAQRDDAVKEYNRIDGQIRVVSARIGTLSSIVIPAIAPVCAVANTLLTPQ